MDSNQLAQVLVQKGGYNPQDAQNAAQGPRSAELAREFGVANVGQSGNANYSQMAQQQLQLNQQANQPIIQNLESQKAPLQQRYQSIIDSLKGREATETTQQQNALSSEYGKRGIPLSSGVFQQDLLGKTQQISQNYGAQEAQAGFQREDALQSIASQIAQLQSGASKDAISQALQQYQFNQQQQAQQQQLQQEANKVNTQIIEVGGRKKLINTQTGSTIQDLGSTATPSNSNESATLSKIFGGNTPNSLNFASSVVNPTPTRAPLTSFLLK